MGLVTGDVWGTFFHSLWKYDIRRRVFFVLAGIFGFITLLLIATGNYLFAIGTAIVATYCKDTSWVNDHYLDVVGRRPVILPNTKAPVTK